MRRFNKAVAFEKLHQKLIDEFTPVGASRRVSSPTSRA
jgi:hypothetical protein